MALIQSKLYIELVKFMYSLDPVSGVDERLRHFDFFNHIDRYTSTILPPSSTHSLAKIIASIKFPDVDGSDPKSLATTLSIVMSEYIKILSIGMAGYTHIYIPSQPLLYSKLVDIEPTNDFSNLDKIASAIDSWIKMGISMLGETIVIWN